MNNDLNSEIFYSLYEKLKIQLQDFKKNDKKQIDSDDVYALYFEKLEYIKKIDDTDNETKKRFLSIIKKINKLEQRSDKQKTLMSISYSVLVDYFKRIHERSDDEIIMLSACSTGMDLDDYNDYIGILSDENVSKAIINKTSNIREQVNIAYDIMDLPDIFSGVDYESIDKSFNLLVNDALNVIRLYKVNGEKEENNIMDNKKMICKDCGNVFEFPATITATDLVERGMDLDEAKKLLASRDLVKSKIATITNEEQRMNIEKDYSKLEQLIVNSSNGNSIEAYEFKGFTMLPNRCPECRKKLKESREQQSEDFGRIHK